MHASSTRSSRPRHGNGLAALALFTQACDAPAASDATRTSPAPSPATAAPSISDTPKLDGDLLVTPPGVPQGSPRPLVVFLHGLGASGPGLANALDVGAIAKKRAFSFVTPEGPKDSRGRRFWNAGGACCDFDGAAPDHAGAIAGLVDAYESSGAARFDQVAVVGFSNGAFMAHRLACDASRITAIVAIAGSIPGPKDPPCRPSHPVRVIVVHGDRDRTVPYQGGPVLGDTTRAVSSAADAARSWASLNGCAGDARATERLDLLSSIDGAETRVDAYEGCRAPVELWTVEGADHLGVLSPDLVDKALGRALVTR